MQKEWIPAISKMTYGIYVLTSSFNDEINGMFASWVSQISYDPPLVMVAVHINRYSHKLIEQGGVFALHALTRNQDHYLSRLKGPDPAAKFTGIEWENGQTGCPILKDCAAYIECRVRETLKPGNHTLFIGEIVAARLIADKEMLSTLDYKGVYLGDK